MKIAYVSGAVIPAASANSIQVMKMCESLARLGHDVSLICRLCAERAGARCDADPFAAYGLEPLFEFVQIKVGRLCKKRAIWVRMLLNRGLAREPDLVYTRTAEIAEKSVQRGFATICEVHALKKSGNKRTLQLNRFARLLRSPNLRRLIAISDVLAAELNHYIPGFDNKIQVARSAADPVPTSAYSPRPASDHVGNIGFCGSLYPGKGMEVIEQVAQLCPEMRFHVVGGRRGELEYWRARLTNTRNVIFHGRKSHDDAFAWIMRFDVCLLPNQPTVATFGGNPAADIGGYTSPIKMFEYMAAAKPIVASELAVLQEVLHQDHNALLCPHDQPEAWARALRRLAGDRNLRARLAKRAHQDVESYYSWRKRAANVLAAN